MKSNKSVNNGGYLLPAHYQAFADFLADFTETAKANGIDLYALSIQNEPDVTAEYASCIWNAAQFHDFIRNHLGPTFKRRSIATKIIAPEYAGWRFDLAEPTMDDSVSRNHLSILGAHTYKPDDKTRPYAKALQFGKRQWQTEVCDLKGIDRSMDNALRWVQEIHTMLTKTRINAWHYWLLDGATKENNEGLWAQGPTKRLYALGNYARFARPGFVLLGTVSASADILVTAFRDTAGSGAIAIVAANKSAAEVSCDFTLNGLGTKTLLPWETSSRADLAKGAEIQIRNGKFTIVLPAKSITTFEGKEPVTNGISIRSAGVRMPETWGGIRISEKGMLILPLERSRGIGETAVRPDGRIPGRSARPRIQGL
jgi:O-glycosyl hydrolase